MPKGPVALGFESADRGGPGTCSDPTGDGPAAAVNRTVDPGAAQTAGPEDAHGNTQATTPHRQARSSGDLQINYSPRAASPLGHGRFGSVFKVYSPSHGRHIAAKRVPTATSDDHFAVHREVDALYRLQYCDHVVKILAHELHNEETIIYMELLSTSVRAYVEANGRLPEETCRRWIRDVLRGLDAMHKANFMHRDIKPGNLLLTEPTVGGGPDSRRVKLADLGLIRDEMGIHSNVGARQGTPQYMAPEVCATKPLYHKAGDVWSVGCTWLTLLTGNLPWAGVFDYVEGNFSADVRKHPDKTPNIPGSLSDDAKLVLQGMLRRDVEQRLTVEQLLCNEYFKEVGGAEANPLPDKPEPAEPVPAESVPAEPVPAEAVLDKPVPAEPAAAEPVPAEPAVAEPVPAEPAVAEPVLGQPVFAERELDTRGQVFVDAFAVARFVSGLAAVILFAWGATTKQPAMPSNLRQSIDSQGIARTISNINGEATLARTTGDSDKMRDVLDALVALVPCATPKTVDDLAMVCSEFAESTHPSSLVTREVRRALAALALQVTTADGATAVAGAIAIAATGKVKLEGDDSDVLRDAVVALAANVHAERAELISKAIIRVASGSQGGADKFATDAVRDALVGLAQRASTVAAVKTAVAAAMSLIVFKAKRGPDLFATRTVQGVVVKLMPNAAVTAGNSFVAIISRIAYDSPTRADLFATDDVRDALVLRASRSTSAYAANFLVTAMSNMVTFGSAENAKTFSTENVKEALVLLMPKLTTNDAARALGALITRITRTSQVSAKLFATEAVRNALIKMMSEVPVETDDATRHVVTAILSIAFHSRDHGLFATANMRQALVRLQKRVKGNDASQSLLAAILNGGTSGPGMAEILTELAPPRGTSADAAKEMVALMSRIADASS